MAIHILMDTLDITVILIRTIIPTRIPLTIPVRRLLSRTITVLATYVHASYAIGI